MCATCWSKVPPDLRSEIYATVGRRSKAGADETWAPWWRAQAKATNFVYLAAGGDRFDAGYRLEKDMLFADYLENKFTAVEHEALRAALRVKWDAAAGNYRAAP